MLWAGGPCARAPRRRERGDGAVAAARRGGGGEFGVANTDGQAVQPERGGVSRARWVASAAGAASGAGWLWVQ